MSCKTWKETAADRRDERNTKVADSPVSVGKKKDTKKWCKGKAGVEHKLQCFPYKNHASKYNKEYYVHACTDCGKEINHYYGTFVSGKAPDWVKDEGKELQSKGTEEDQG